jgi:squalene-hopene/tetraprenyl-beta-curcumene cyclase
VKRPDVEPGGWYFEFANEFYPDIDDTAMVLLALEHAKATDPAASRRPSGARSTGCWPCNPPTGAGRPSTWTTTGSRSTTCPFADHNAMLDPTCPDITGRVLEALCARLPTAPTGRGSRRPYLLRRTQEPEGCWYGRWGVNYIYGTFLALRGLRAAGEASREAHILRAAEWLRAIQNADGGWGESCASYDRLLRARPSTASQTAWALLGLLAAGDSKSQSVLKGVALSDRTQRDGRELARRAGHRDRISQGLLPGLSSIPAVLSFAGAR